MGTGIILQNKVIDTIESKPFSYKYWKRVSDIPVCWDQLVSSKDLFLSTAYFSALEKAAPKGIKHCFVGFYNEQKLIGVALFQMVHIKASETYRSQPSDKKGFNLINEFLKIRLLKLFNLKVLVGGNLMLTGEHSFYFDYDSISAKEALHLWYKAICDLKKNEFKPSLTLLKDFFEYKRYDFEVIKRNQNHSYYVEPNMILHIRPEWNTLADYTADMKKKYRARVTTAKKKMIGLTKKSLSYPEIVEHRTSLFKLYKSVSDNASFNTFVLNENYFEEMKRNLGKKFRLIAYFLEGKVVGFFTIILTQNKVVTHFLGYCPECNKDYQLYFNMLIDMVEIGIEEKLEDVIYARTALEIKSSIGAVPYEMKGFMKYENPVLNKVIFSLFKFIKPDDQWIQRHPFKEN